MAKTADPMPVGTFAYGLMLFVVGFYFTEKAGGFSPGAMVSSCLASGLLQVYSGILSYFYGSTLFLTIFLAFGLYSIAFAGIFAFPAWELLEAPNDTSSGIFYLGWSLMSLSLLVAAIYTSWALIICLLLTTLSMFLLAISYFTLSLAGLHVAAYVLIVTGLCWMYLSWGRTYCILYGNYLPEGKRSQYY